MYFKKNELKMKRLQAGGMRQFELARELKISCSKLSGIENCYIPVDENTYAKINEILSRKSLSK